MKPTTAAIVAGSRLPASAAHPLSPPIFTSAAGWFEEAERLDGALDGQDFVYGRIAAPTAQLLEEAIATLEGAEACAAFASGMAALRAVFEAQALKPGDRVVVPGDGYGATRALFAQLCAERGARLIPVMLAEPGAGAVLKQVHPQLVLIESVTNPLVSVPDLPALCAAAREVGAVIAVDGGSAGRLRLTGPDLPVPWIRDSLKISTRDFGRDRSAAPKECRMSPVKRTVEICKESRFQRTREGAT